MRTLSYAMRDCEQTPGQNVLEHGSAVREKFRELHRFIMSDETELEGWRIPDWVFSHREKFRENDSLAFDIEKYLTVHDCGKPFCVPSETRKFPDHHIVSRDTWGEHEGTELVLRLIESDMVLHVGKAPEAVGLLESSFGSSCR